MQRRRTISALSQCTWLSSPAFSLPSLPLLQPEALSDLCCNPSTPTQLPAGLQYPSTPTHAPSPPGSVPGMIQHSADETHGPSHFCGKRAGFPSPRMLRCLRGSWRHSSVMPSLPHPRHAHMASQPISLHLTCLVSRWTPRLQRKVAGCVGKEDRMIWGWGVFICGLLEDMELESSILNESFRKN